MEIIKTQQKRRTIRYRKFFQRIFSDLISESAASLSYCFILSVFPFLILFSIAVASLHLNAHSVTNLLDNFLPAQIVSLVDAYISEIGKGDVFSLLFVGIFLTVYSMGKAVQTLKRKIRKAFRARPKTHFVGEWLVSFVFVLLMIVAFYATLIILVAGNGIIDWIGNFIEISGRTFALLYFLRIVLIAAFLFFMLFGIYYVLPGVKLRRKDVLPGTVFAMSGWVVASWLFSFYVNHMNDYSAVYGSLGAMIILLIWLHIICTIMLLGAYINAHFYLDCHGDGSLDNQRPPEKE